MDRVFHPAKIGDIIYSLPAIIQRGGVKEYHIQREHVAQYLKSLLENQSYIGVVVHNKNCPDKVDINFETYQAFYRLMLGCDLIKLNCITAGIRTHHFPLKLSGVTFHSDHVKYMDGLHIDLDKYRNIQAWKPDKAFLETTRIHAHDIIINRSPRYNEDYFDYTLLKDYDCGFIGLEEEYEDFKKKYGDWSTYLKITSAADVAKFIGGSKLFVGNQSSCKAIAEGLKHPRLIEISKTWPDAMPVGKYGHIIITKELIEYYINNDIKLVKIPEINFDSNIKSIGLSNFFE